MTKVPTTNEFIQHLSQVVEHCTFDAGRTGRLSPPQLCAVYHQEKLHGGATALFAQADVPEDTLNSFVETCRPILNAHINSEKDRIGNGIVNLIGGVPQPTIAEFARILIRAAAIQGARRTSELLFGWIDGEPLNYKVKVLLSGITIDRSLKLSEELEVSELPKSSNELTPQLPPLSMYSHGLDGLLGGVILSIECRAGPALYAPEKNDSLSSKFEIIWAGGQIPGLSLDSFCEALSLACNHCIRWRQHWSDFGDLQIFAGAISGIAYTDVPRWGASVSLSYEQFEHARDIHLVRHAP